MTADVRRRPHYSTLSMVGQPGRNRGGVWISVEIPEPGETASGDLNGTLTLLQSARNHPERSTEGVDLAPCAHISRGPLAEGPVEGWYQAVSNLGTGKGTLRQAQGEIRL